MGQLLQSLWTAARPQRGLSSIRLSLPNSGSTTRTASVLLLVAIVGCTRAKESVSDLPDDAPLNVQSCDASPEGMVCIEGGSFNRGSDQAPACSEPGTEPSLPAERTWVQTTYMDTHEVRWGDYQLCVVAGECEALEELESMTPALLDPRQPITGVTWSQAATYCQAVGKHLPTETEWEHAARGSGGTLYPWNNTPASCSNAVVSDENGPSCGSLLNDREETVPQPLRVGSRMPSPTGIYDQVGNAAEWVADWHLSDLSNCGEECSGPDPLGPCEGAETCELSDLKVVRGGAWNQPSECNSSVVRRGLSPVSGAGPDVGFRCAASPAEASLLTAPAHRSLAARAGETICSQWETSKAPGPPASFHPESWAAGDKQNYRQTEEPAADVSSIDGETHEEMDRVKFLFETLRNPSYKNPEMVEHQVCSYASIFHKQSQVYLIGRSVQGRPILALRVSKTPREGRDRPAVLLNGGHHGDELLSIEYALDAMRNLFGSLHTEEVLDWLETYDIWFVPLVNPDGTDTVLHHNRGTNMGRKNGRDANEDGVYTHTKDGVDLNRNYPFMWAGLRTGSSPKPSSSYFRGKSPGSEPEARAIMHLAGEHRFVASISWHTNGTMIISPYTIDGIKNPVPDIAWSVAEELKKATPRQPNHRNFKVKRSMYPVDGTDQDWLYHEFGTLAYIVEGSHHNPLDLVTRKASIEGTRPIYWALLNRLQTGPSVYGSVRDSLGNPIEAIVEVDGYQMRAGEQWSSRPSDGYFERILLDPGTYTLHFTTADGARKSKIVNVEEGRTSVEVVLGP